MTTDSLRFETHRNQAPVTQEIKKTTPTDTVSTTKLLKIALVFFAAVSGAIGYLALTIGTAPALILAIPTLTITGLLIWTVYRIKDYADPKELEQYRSEAAYQSLEKTAREHGWDNMFKYEIPTKANFRKLYFDMVNKTSFDKQVSIYEGLSKIREKCIADGNTVEITLPSPKNFERTFFEQVRGKQLCDIFGKYDFEKLVKYEIVSKDVLELKKAYLKASDEKALAVQEVNREFKDYRSRATNRFESALKSALQQYRRDLTREEREWLACQRLNINNIRNNNLDDLIVAYLHPQSALHAPFEAFRNGIHAIRQRREEGIYKAKQKFDETCKTINEAFPLKK